MLLLLLLLLGELELLLLWREGVAVVPHSHHYVLLSIHLCHYLHCSNTSLTLSMSSLALATSAPKFLSLSIANSTCPRSSLSFSASAAARRRTSAAAAAQAAARRAASARRLAPRRRE